MMYFSPSREAVDELLRWKIAMPISISEIKKFT